MGPIIDLAVSRCGDGRIACSLLLLLNMVVRIQRKRGATTHAKKRNNAAQKAADDAKFVDDVFAKYDTSHDGKLGQTEMRELLTKLNGGEAPTEVEVQLIVDSVDKRGGTSDGAINKDELSLDSSTKQSSYKRSRFGSPIAPWMETTRTSLLHQGLLLTNHRALNRRRTQLVASFFDLCALLSSITLFIGLYIYVQQCYKHSMLQNIRILVFRLNIFIFFEKK